MHIHKLVFKFNQSNNLTKQNIEWKSCLQPDTLLLLQMHLSYQIVYIEQALLEN